MASEEKGENKDEVFNLSTSSAEFQAKTKDIFGCLAVLEDKHIAHEKTRNLSDDAHLWKNDPLVDDYKIIDTRTKSQKRGAEFSKDESETHPQFKRPKLGALKARHRRPDHEIHPEKWKEYSLKDVSLDDMSEKSNTRAALDFIEDRRRTREAESDPELVTPANIEESACSKGVVTFVKKSKEKVDSSVGEKSQVDEAVAKVRHSFEEAEDTDAVDSGLPVNSVTADEEKSVSFKSRKSNKRSIRSRNVTEDDDHVE